MNEWTPICQLEDIPVLGSRRVSRAHGMDVAVFRNDKNEVFALLDRCPHKGGPLSQGIVFGTSVACPLHNWTIGLCTGQAAAPDVGCTPRFEVKVDAGQFHRVGLWNGSWETVKQKPFGAIGLGDTFFDQPDDDVVADQSTGIHDFFGR